MNYLYAEKYNISWFKLAEYVSRKERERAFGIYRLLTYSINNEALIVQLEGDLLLAFNDVSHAVECYLKAAEIYKKHNKIIDAVKLYELILSLQPKNIDIFIELIKIYGSTGFYYKLDLPKDYSQTDFILSDFIKNILSYCSSSDPDKTADFLLKIVNYSPSLYSYALNNLSKELVNFIEIKRAAVRDFI